ncbi:hypothetical protein TNCV_751141 [Trichonephila clavipes]|nr:hypothetical protein TNCV_751141 [Trichonephila clavipes]
MLAKNFKKYFQNEDNLVASYEWIRHLFQGTPEGLSTSEEIFIDFTSSEKLKGNFVINRSLNFGYDRKNKRLISFLDFPSAIRLVPHGPNIPVPLPPTKFQKLFRYIQSQVDRENLCYSRYSQLLKDNAFETCMTAKAKEA